MICAESIQAVAEPKGAGYIVTTPTGTCKLKRDSDFGIIKGCGSKPSLFKEGAIKLAKSNGLIIRNVLVDKIECFDGKDNYYSYMFECKLIKAGVVDGKMVELEYGNAYASANTKEKRNGFNSAENAQNSAIKMAQKRALTSAIINALGIADIFTMDIEDEEKMKNAEFIFNEDPEAPLTTKQTRRIFAVAGEKGLTQERCKQKLAEMGFTSTKDVKQKDLENVIRALEAIE